MDFVRKSVRAIGRCAIKVGSLIILSLISTFHLFLKVEQSAERCVSTLLDLIQTKVNYVVQVNKNVSLYELELTL